MDTNVVVAMISLIGTLGGSLGGILVSSKLTNYRLQQLENRVSFRVAQKIAIRKVMMSHALGIKTSVAGRLGGVEIARTEGYSEGVIPMNTLRSDLDYAVEKAHTTYGIIGVKV